MAEVKTYKCDICGEVYHEEENYKHFMHIEDEYRTREEGSVKHYEHICPDCRENVCKCIDKPDIINVLSNKSYKRHSALLSIEHKIKHLRDRLCGWKGYVVIDWDEEAAETINVYVDEIETAYNKTEKSRNIWRGLAIMFGSAFITQIVLLLI